MRPTTTSPVGPTTHTLPRVTSVPELTVRVLKDSRVTMTVVMVPIDPKVSTTTSYHVRDSTLTPQGPHLPHKMSFLSRHSVS